MNPEPFVYRARPVNVVDGDTFDAVFDLGFQIEREIRIRLADVDTAEIYGVKKGSDEYETGVRHKEHVENWFDAACDAHDGEWPIYIRTEKTGKYGRYIGDVVSAEPLDVYARSLTEELIDAFGDAVKYDS